MKHIKEFKIFEKYDDVKIANELIDSLSDEIISRLYFDRYYYDNVEDIFTSNIKNSLNHIDVEEFFYNIKEEEIKNSNITDFKKDDYIEWIYDNLSDDIKKEMSNIYKNKKYIKDTRFPDTANYLIYKLNKNDLETTIKNLNLEHVFIEDTINSKYDKYDNDIEKYIIEKYGKNYQDYCNKIYNLLIDYTDIVDLVDKYNNNISTEYKKETLITDIEYNYDLQSEIVDAKISNIFKLAKYLSNNFISVCILDLYDYQKIFIEEYAKKKPNNENAKAKAIKYINDNFELDSEIEEEYPDDMWMVNADNFNL